MDDTFSHVDYKPVRAGVYLAMSGSGALSRWFSRQKSKRTYLGLLPAIHFAITDGYDKLFDELAMVRMYTMCFCYLLGAVLYAFKVPERWWPGKFDIWVKLFTV